MSHVNSKIFEHLSTRQFDILVGSTLSKNSRLLQAIHIHYYELGQCSCFSFSMRDRQYANNRQELLHAAVKKLLIEINSRLLSGQDFAVLYFDDDTRVIVERAAGEIARLEPAQERKVNKLLFIGSVMGENPSGVS